MSVLDTLVSQTLWNTPIKERKSSSRIGLIYRIRKLPGSYRKTSQPVKMPNLYFQMSFDKISKNEEYLRAFIYLVKLLIHFQQIVWQQVKVAAQGSPLTPPVTILLMSSIEESEMTLTGMMWTNDQLRRFQTLCWWYFFKYQVRTYRGTKVP